MGNQQFFNLIKHLGKPGEDVARDFLHGTPPLRDALFDKEAHRPYRAELLDVQDSLFDRLAHPVRRVVCPLPTSGDEQNA